MHFCVGIVLMKASKIDRYLMVEMKDDYSPFHIRYCILFYAHWSGHGVNYTREDSFDYIDSIYREM